MPIQIEGEREIACVCERERGGKIEKEEENVRTKKREQESA